MESNFNNENQTYEYNFYDQTDKDIYSSETTAQELNYDPSYQGLMINKTGKKMYQNLGLAYLFFTLVAVILPIIVLIIVKTITGFDMSTNIDGQLIITYCSMYLIGFPVLLLILNSRKDESYIYLDQTNKHNLEFKQMLQLFFASYAVMQIFNLLSVLFNNFISEALGDYSLNDIGNMDNYSPVVGFLIIVVIAPIMEEIVFRWLPYKKVGKMGEKPYVIYTAIAFGLFHMNFVQMFYAAALGVIFGCIMYRTGKVIYSIILHFLVNLMGFVLSHLSLTNNLEIMGSAGLFVILFVLAGVIIIIITALSKGRQVLNLGTSFLKLRYAMGNIPTVIFLLLLILISLTTIIAL